MIQEVIYPAWQKAFSVSNILSGFRKTGVWPMNANAISDSELKPAQLFSDKPQTVSEFVQELKSHPDKALPPANMPMKPMEPYLESLLDVPVYKGPERKAKEKPQARLLTNEVFITRLFEKRANEAAKKEKKAQNAAKRAAKATNAKKPAATPKRKSKPRQKEPEDSESEGEESEESQDSEEEPDSPVLGDSDDDQPTPPRSRQHSKDGKQNKDDAEVEALSLSHAAESKGQSQSQSSSSSNQGSSTSNARKENKNNASNDDKLDICRKCSEKPAQETAVRCKGCAQVYHKSCTGSSRRNKSTLMIFPALGAADQL
jgi:hypothetical protein